MTDHGRTRDNGLVAGGLVVVMVACLAWCFCGRRRWAVGGGSGSGGRRGWASRATTMVMVMCVRQSRSLPSLLGVREGAIRRGCVCCGVINAGLWIWLIPDESSAACPA